MLTLKNVRIDNCGTGISAPKDAVIHADGLEITNTGKAIDLRDPPSLLQALGLPAGTPPQHLLDAIQLLEANKALPPEQRSQALHSSSLFKWLGNTANLATISSALIQAHQQGLIPAVLMRLFGL